MSRRWLTTRAVISALAMTLAVCTLAASGGCLPVPVSGMPRSLGEVEVQWTAVGHDYWVCTASGFGYEVHIRWSAMRCEHLKAVVRAAGDGRQSGGYLDELAEGAQMERDVIRGDYELALSEGAEEFPVLQLEKLPEGMKQAADACHRIALEIEAHEGAAKSVLPRIPLAYIADIARSRFAILPTASAEFGLARSLHYQGGQAVYVYRGSRSFGGKQVELEAYLCGRGSVFLWRESGSRSCVVMQDDELILRVPEDRSRGKLKLPGLEAIDFQTFRKRGSAMLRLAESEGMLEGGTEQELVGRVLSALDSHEDFDRTEPASTEAEMDPWGILGGGA